MQSTIWSVLPRRLVHATTSQRRLHKILGLLGQQGRCIPGYELASAPMGQRSNTPQSHQELPAIPVPLSCKLLTATSNHKHSFLNSCFQDRPKRCNNPKVCNLWHKSGVRYMRTCQPCPDIYPWTGKTGIRSSRIDNDIED